MFRIESTEIGENVKPYIIAELSANHDGSITNAMLGIKVAKDCGANAVKIQTYTPDTMTIRSNKPGFVVSDGPWKGRSLYDIYSEGYTPFEWHKSLFNYAKSLDITLFSTPFDETAVDLLQELDAPAYKIASFELTDLPLIKRAAECGKPLLISTGMATISEVAEALNTALKYGSDGVLLFHCISSYPASVTDAHLRNIEFLRSEFGVEVGLSDHTLSNLAATLSVGLGASAIEKHFKPSNDTKGLDSSFSINPDQLKALVIECNDAWRSLGSAGFHRSTSEAESSVYRRSLYFMKDLKKGDLVEFGDIRAIRPGFGLSPKFLDGLIGKVLVQDVERGDPVSFEVFAG